LGFVNREIMLKGRQNMDMKITGAYSVYNVQPVKSTTTQPVQKIKGKQSVGDVVSVSAAANEFGVARRAVSELPDVREAHVKRLQAQLQSGTYHVSSSDIAARIFAVDE
jgi:flagellar biosynthesis anti-sigma factor FlgM